MGICRPDGSKVGADPSLTGAHTWLDWEKQLKSANLVLVPLEVNPIDKVWTTGRPQRSTAPLEIHDVKYAGNKTNPKVSAIILALSRFLRKMGLLYS